jgi:hypothetical protein
MSGMVGKGGDGKIKPNMRDRYNFQRFGSGPGEAISEADTPARPPSR